MHRATLASRCGQTDSLELRGKKAPSIFLAKVYACPDAEKIADIIIDALLVHQEDQAYISPTPVRGLPFTTIEDQP